MNRLRYKLLLYVTFFIASCAIRFDVPFERTGSGHYVVPVETSCGTRRFLFDMGCGITMVSEDLAYKLEIRDMYHSK